MVVVPLHEELLEHRLENVLSFGKRMAHEIKLKIYYSKAHMTIDNKLKQLGITISEEDGQKIAATPAASRVPRTM